MKKFLSRIVLFFIPILMVYVLFGIALYQSGEWRTEDDIVEMLQKGEPAFFGLAYRGNDLYFKHEATVALKPRLLVLGTSRSMQFSSKFFTEPSFYNAGGAAGYTHAYRFFFENLPPEAMPEKLIVVLDQYFFQEGWSSTLKWPALDFAHYDFDARVAFSQLMRDWAKGKYRLTDMLTPPKNTYGVAAVGRGSGFYPDGSYCYGNLVDHPEKGTDVGFADTYGRIRLGNRRFEWSEDIYTPSLEEMGRFMALCHENGVEVVAVIPPYPPSVWAEMEASGNYGYIPKLLPALTQILEPYGYEVYDFTNMPNTLDEEYIDGYHGGDRVYARIALELSEKSRILSGLIDREYLERALAPGDNPLRLSA